MNTKKISKLKNKVKGDKLKKKLKQNSYAEEYLSTTRDV